MRVTSSPMPWRPQAQPTTPQRRGGCAPPHGGIEWGEGDHNHPLPTPAARPRGDKFHPKVDFGGFLEPRGGGAARPLSAKLEDTCKVIFHRGEGDQNHPGQMCGHEVTASPQTGYKGASQGLGLGPAQGGGPQRQGATSGGPPITGMSSRAPANPARGGKAPRRRLHGRASSEVT